MLAKSLTFLADADAAGIVLGARVPIILTSRADSTITRLASCAVASLVADAQRAQLAIAGGLSHDTRLIVLNAGSSSLKFQVFEMPDGAEPRLVWRGLYEGLGGAARFVVKDAGRERSRRDDLEFRATGSGTRKR